MDSPKSSGPPNEPAPRHMARVITAWLDACVWTRSPRLIQDGWLRHHATTRACSASIYTGTLGSPSGAAAADVASRFGSFPGPPTGCSEGSWKSMALSTAWRPRLRLPLTGTVTQGASSYATRPLPLESGAVGMLDHAERDIYFGWLGVLRPGVVHCYFRRREKWTIGSGTEASSSLLGLCWEITTRTEKR